MLYQKHFTLRILPLPVVRFKKKKQGVPVPSAISLRNKTKWKLILCLWIPYVGISQYVYK